MKVSLKGWDGWVQYYVRLGFGHQFQGGQRGELLHLTTEGAPSTVYILRHHSGAHMPDLGGRRGREGIPESLLAFNIKDLG